MLNFSCNSALTVSVGQISFSSLQKQAANLSSWGSDTIPRLFLVTHRETLVSILDTARMLQPDKTYDDDLLGKTNFVASSSMDKSAH